MSTPTRLLVAAALAASALAAPKPRTPTSPNAAALAASKTPVEVAVIETAKDGAVALACHGSEADLACTLTHKLDGKSVAASVSLTKTKTELVYVVSGPWIGQVNMIVGRASGAIAKGPFVRGAEVWFRPLDDRAGAFAFAVRTLDDRGRYARPFALAGPTWVEASGRFFDEGARALSEGPVRLSALHGPGIGADVDVLSHLTALRARRLLEGRSASEAVTAARRELGAALGIDGDAEARFRLSTVLTVVAGRRAQGTRRSRGDCLQALLDDLADDLADDGALDRVTVAELDAAGRDLDFDAAREAMRRYLDGRL